MEVKIILELRKGIWVMTQTWNDLLFMHLPVPADILREQIPQGLELDTYNGKAWISIVPFAITDMRLHFTPRLPYFHFLLELNVRTYVKRNGEAGVYFFSLDANQWLTVLGGRIFHAPYHYAGIHMKKERNWINFISKRKGKSSIGFTGKYRPVTGEYKPSASSLAYWLVERYIFWSERNSSLYKGDIYHEPWKLQEAEVILSKQNMLPDFLGIEEAGNPVFHYAAKKKVYSWCVRKIEEL